MAKFADFIRRNDRIRAGLYPDSVGVLLSLGGDGVVKLVMVLVIEVLMVKKLGVNRNEEVILRSAIFFPTGAAQMLAELAQRL